MSLAKILGLTISLTGILILVLGISISYFTEYPDPAYAWILITFGFVLVLSSMYFLGAENE